MASQIYPLIRLAEKFLPSADVESALPIILDLIVKNTSAERCKIELYQGDQTIFEAMATAGSSRFHSEENRISKKIIEIVKKTGRIFETVNAMRDNRLASPEDREATVVRQHILSAVCAPLLDGDALFGLLYIDNRTEERRFSDETRLLLSDFAEMLSSLASELLEPLKKSLARSIEQRRKEALYLETRHRNEALQGYGDLLGTSPLMQQVFQQIEYMKDLGKANVLILGETGTGKELVARELHRRSIRKLHEFVAFDCSEVPETMIESALFGHEKGAFTDAKVAQIGCIEQAEGGTLFLDEIGNISLHVQKKLLRFLQDKSYRKLGSAKQRTADVRLIFATNENLEHKVKNGEFRIDLFYRLTNVEAIQLPPLRERGEDILLLAKMYLEKANQEYNTRVRFSSVVKACLLEYSFPGNIRELEKIVNSAFFRAFGYKKAKKIEPDDLLPEVRANWQDDKPKPARMVFDDTESRFYARYLPEHAAEHNFIFGQAAESSAERSPTRTLHDYLLTAVHAAAGLRLEEAKKAVGKAFERNFLMMLLQKANGKIIDAAKLADIDRRTFSDYMSEHGIEKNWYKE